MVDIDSLNPQQKDAAISYQGSTLILAGAGTGKTRVITCRIAYMLDCGIQPNEIAAMTFTNKAAREMKERIQEMVGKGRAKSLSISTFHSFCISLLRKYHEEAGVPAKFTLLGTSDQMDLINKALEEKNWGNLFKADLLLYQIGTCKNWLITPDDLRNGLLPQQQIEDAAVLADVYELYERQLKLNRAIDFDDCIFRVVKMLENRPDLCEKIAKQYKYILVDEFQDTNFTQFKVIEKIASIHGNICVVGDDDQSIYSWRGAMFETMQKFEQTFSNTKVVKLEQNYRCTNVILNAANGVIKNNLQRMEKTLWSATEDKTPIVIAALEDATEESRWVTTKCIEYLGMGYQPRDIAILYRSNAQAKSLEMALRESSISYKTFGGQSFFERKEVKNFLGYLRLVSNHDDHMALWRVINTPLRGIGLKTQETIEFEARAKNISPYKVIKHVENLHITGKSENSVKDFVEKINILTAIELETPEDLEKLGLEIISTFRLEDDIKRNVKNVMAKHYRIENLRSLPKWLKKSAEEMVGEDGTLDAFKLLDRLTMSDAPAKDDKEALGNYVSLMTVHASKGLEFPIVFVVGCEEGLLPHKNSLQTLNGISEERRLFYVALTRAKTRLNISFAHTRQTGFQNEIKKPSRFLRELPEDLQNFNSAQNAMKVMAQLEDNRKTNTLSALKSLKDQLSLKN